MGRATAFPGMTPWSVRPKTRMTTTSRALRRSICRCRLSVQNVTVDNRKALAGLDPEGSAASDCSIPRSSAVLHLMVDPALT